MSHIITGNLYLNSIPQLDSIPQSDALTELSYFLLEKALKNRIGLNIGNNLSIIGIKKYPLIDYHNYINDDGYMPYEIVEPPYCIQFESMGAGVYYTDKEFKISDLSESHIPRIQSFLEEIIVHKNILYITFQLEDIHMHLKDIVFFEDTIHAHQFIQTIIDAPNYHRIMPNLKLKIIK